MPYKSQSLPDPIKAIVLNKGTEYPFTGEYNDFEEKGTYLCRQCGLALFKSDTKYHAGCGWPSFDDEVPGAVLKQKDTDNIRTEILCNRCHAHLGHIFVGERQTPKNTRYCVNSKSLDFISDTTVSDTKEAIFAAGCFWGVEYYFKKLLGVLKTEVGYIGGHLSNPNYEKVCAGNTGHYEAIRVLYDPNKISFEQLAKFFFEIHDPTQTNGQGPDLGKQYLSVAFYYDDNEKEILLKLIATLEAKGYKIATKVLPVAPFWAAEEYHQDYYDKTGKMPYCHVYRKIFD